MSRTKNAQALKRRREIIRIFNEAWNPIGVSPGSDGPDDEYISYVPATEKLLLSGADAVKISAHLCHCTRVNMGLSTNGDRERAVADMLIEMWTTLESR